MSYINYNVICKHFCDKRNIEAISYVDIFAHEGSILCFCKYCHKTFILEDYGRPGCYAYSYGTNEENRKSIIITTTHKEFEKINTIGDIQFLDGRLGDPHKQIYKKILQIKSEKKYNQYIKNLRKEEMYEYLERPPFRDTHNGYLHDTVRCNYRQNIDLNAFLYIPNYQLSCNCKGEGFFSTTNPYESEVDLCTDCKKIFKELRVLPPVKYKDLQQGKYEYEQSLKYNYDSATIEHLEKIIPAYLPFELNMLNSNFEYEETPTDLEDYRDWLENEKKRN